MAEASEPALRSYRAPLPSAGRWEAADPDRAFVLEAVYEGYLLHYAQPRAFRDMDPDLRLLSGDALYALGLARLADREDLEAVAELAGLISDCARAEAEGRPQEVAGLWDASAARLGARRVGDEPRNP
jgi:hypothetical protein